jgi:Ca-activated chloride channel homolog
VKQLQIVGHEQTFRLKEGQTTFLVGSDAIADFNLTYPAIVGRHAKFTRRGQAWGIEPIDGKVFVNHDEIEMRETIAIGDQIQLGTLLFQVEAQTNEQTTVAPAPLPQTSRQVTPPFYIRSLIGRLPKPILFGICGAIGCMMAAMLLGEPLLNFTKLPPSTSTAQAIVLVIDCSDSMDAPKLKEVKLAAQTFVERQNLSENRISVVGFGSQARLVSNLTNNKSDLSAAIAMLANQGGTVMHLGLDAAMGELESSPFKRRILLFTDGQANDPLPTLRSARIARVQGNSIIAIATGNANDYYLAQVTGSANRVIRASTGNFEQAFQRSEEVISSLVEDNLEGSYSYGHRILRIGGWTACLAIGTSLALIAGQSLYSRHRTIFSPQKGSLGLLGGAIAGSVAGAVGEALSLPVVKVLFFYSIDAISSGVGWVLMGVVFAGVLSRLGLSVPIKQAMTRGAIGGVGAAIAYTLGEHLSSGIGMFFGMISLYATAFLLGSRTKISCLGSLFASALALTISSFFALPIETLVIIDLLTRILGWTLLGLLLGAGMTQCVPNLKISRGLLGGGLGGATGAIGFILLKSGTNELIGRALGTAILGFVIGLMIAWAERLGREAWIVAHWTASERKPFSLGTKPVIIGSSGEADICLSQSYPPKVAEVYLKGGQIMLKYDESMRNQGITVLEKRLKNKEIQEIGDIKIEVRTSKNMVSL